MTQQDPAADAKKSETAEGDTTLTLGVDASTIASEQAPPQTSVVETLRQLESEKTAEGEQPAEGAPEDVHTLEPFHEITPTAAGEQEALALSSSDGAADHHEPALEPPSAVGDEQKGEGDELKPLDDLAETVMIGLEQAGLIDTEAAWAHPKNVTEAQSQQTQPEPPSVDESSGPEGVDAVKGSVLAYLHGLKPGRAAGEGSQSEARGEEPREQPYHEDHPSVVRSRSAFQQGSERRDEPDYRQSTSPTVFARKEPSLDTSQKEDALADAVRTALDNLYGPKEVTEPGRGQQRAPWDRAPQMAASGGHKSPEDLIASYFDYTAEPSAAGEGTGDHKSAEDIIASYLDYAPKPTVAVDHKGAEEIVASYLDYAPEPSGPNGHKDSKEFVAKYLEQAPSTGRPWDRSGEERDTGIFRARAAHHPGSSPYSLEQQAVQAPSQDVQLKTGGKQPTMPPPTTPGQPLVPTQTPPRQHHPAESSKLLGAAGLGLVGGIAIAAALAVFVINANGPNPASSPLSDGDLRSAELSQPGRDEQDGAAGNQPEGGNAQIAGGVEVLAADVNSGSRQQISLPVALRSEKVSSDQLLVSITGLPAGARLNVGVDAGGGNWVVPPKQLNEVALTLPQGASNPVTLEAQAIDIMGRTPVSEKKKFTVWVSEPATAAPSWASASVVEAGEAARQAGAGGFATKTTPASAAKDGAQSGTAATRGQHPPAQGATAGTGGKVAALSPGGAADLGAAKALSRPEIEDLIREGNKRMREGDIKLARELYQKAYALGDAEAALAMGRSFDPIYFERIQKKNAEPDPIKAFEWYKLAMDGGAAQTAKIRIDNLKQYLALQSGP